jgi:hypothetical protein
MGPALEVVMGLSMMLFIFASVASAIVELIGRFFRVKEKRLEQAISTMLGPSSLEKSPIDATKESLTNVATTLPIDVADAFFNLRTIKTLKEVEPNWKIHRWLMKSTSNTPAFLSARVFADGVVDALTGVNLNAEDNLFEKLPSNLKGVLRPMSDGPGDDLAMLKIKLEHWFNELMRGLGERYRRWAKWISFAVGLGLAVSLNASVFHVADKLWSEPIVRESVVQTVDDLVKKSDGTALTVKSVDEMVTQISNLDSAKIPMGWDGIRFSKNWFLVNLAGWLVTALLIMLGAPFWYDVMTNISPLRKLKESKSKDDSVPTTNVDRLQRVNVSSTTVDSVPTMTIALAEPALETIKSELSKGPKPPPKSSAALWLNEVLPKRAT